MGRPHNTVMGSLLVIRALLNNTLKQHGELLSEWHEGGAWLVWEQYLQLPWSEELSSVCLETANYQVLQATK